MLAYPYYEFHGRKIIDAVFVDEKLTATFEGGEQITIMNNGQDLRRIADDIARFKAG